MRINNVLVPVDFSPPSRLAVDYGIALARVFRARLTLLHTVELTKLAVAPHEAEDAAGNLSALVGPEDKGDLDVRTIAKVGDVQDRILETIREQNADFVVLGTHGRGVIGRALIGSVTQKLLRKLEIPMFTVCHVTGPLKFSRILFATDLSDASESAFRFALDLAKSQGSRLTILHSLEYGRVNYGVIETDRVVREQLFNQAKTHLEEIAARAESEGVAAEISLVRGDAGEQILALADRSEADLILLSIERKGLLERALLGSTAERVIRDALVPVLSIPSTNAESVIQGTRQAS